MLTHLLITNYALIDHLEIDFKKGLTIITGETGAGKSIIIDAINAILGERTSRELIRTDSNNAEVSAFFENNDYSELIEKQDQRLKLYSWKKTAIKITQILQSIWDIK